MKTNLLFNFAAAVYTSWDSHYESGKYAYGAKQWHDVVNEIEAAISQKLLLENSQSDCRNQCAKTTETDDQDLGVGYSQYVLLRASCITQCLKERNGAHWVDQRYLDDLEQEFRNCLPYQFLNVAYYHDDRLAKAVSSAYTFFQANPNPEGLQTLDYFADNPEVSNSMYTDMESRMHLNLYESATAEYQIENYQKAITLFQSSLDAYYDEIKKCRALCEKPIDLGSKYQESLPTYHLLQVAHTGQVIECRLKCIKKMESKTNTYVRRSNINLLPIHYHYLMFAYNEVQDSNNALKMAKTYLLFHPGNEQMTRNVAMLDKSKSSSVGSDDAALVFLNQVQKEVAILEYMEQHFGFKHDSAVKTPFPDDNTFDKEDAVILEREDAEWKLNGFVTETRRWDEETLTAPVYTHHIKNDNMEEYESMDEKLQDLIEAKEGVDELAPNANVKNKYTAKKKYIRTVHGDLIDYTSKPGSFGYVVRNSPKYVVIGETNTTVTPDGPVPNGAKLIANAETLLGPERFAMDNVITQEECDILSKLGRSGEIGDGYGGEAHPHSSGESFKGIRLLTAAQLAEKGDIPIEHVELYNEIEKRMGKIIGDYNGLDEPLYADFIHLVCRNPEDQKTVDEDGNLILSHPVHPDNCNYQNDGTCPRKKPAYIWREYSGVLYLNDDIEGGEVFFTDRSGKYAMIGVRPKCGRLISFCAGIECLHGVKKLTKGDRCALPVWFTTKSEHVDYTLKEAEAIIKKLSN